MNEGNLAWIISIVPICILIVHVFIGMIVYRDAKNIGANPVLWTIIAVVLPNFIGIIIYLVFGRRKRSVICTSCNQIVDGTVKYCGNCGQNLEFYREIKKKPVKNLLIGGLVAFIIAIVLIVVGGVVFYNNPQKLVIEETNTSIQSEGEDTLKGFKEEEDENSYKVEVDFGNTTLYFDRKTNKKLEVKSKIKDGFGILKVNYKNGTTENITLDKNTKIIINKGNEKIKNMEIELKNAKDFNIGVYLK